MTRTPTAAFLLLLVSGAAHAERATPLPAPAHDPASATATETVVLSGGCFWGVQGVFEHVKGVQQVVSGYAGGARDTAEYETVSTGSTGHAESVQVRFDPKTVSYGQLLRIFFSVALDPTQKDRQGPDSGTQYRSEVFYTSDAQQQAAQAYIAQLDAAKIFPRPIATRVDRLPAFYPAEGYHQDYLIHHPDSMYIVMNDLPKIDALKKLFPDWYVEKPVMVSATKSGT